MLQGSVACSGLLTCVAVVWVVEVRPSVMGIPCVHLYPACWFICHGFTTVRWPYRITAVKVTCSSVNKNARLLRLSWFVNFCQARWSTIVLICMMLLTGCLYFCMLVGVLWFRNRALTSKDNSGQTDMFLGQQKCLIAPPQRAPS